jgi:pimeloyl-ACP methyl ester carboxylesterase
MPQTTRSGVRIQYQLAGSGSPLLLVHGYTASGYSNWVHSGWVEFLSSRHTLLVPDLRGHGRSQKPHSSSAYSLPALTSDALAVMDQEGIASAPVFGYSMGGMVTLDLLLNHSARVDSAIIGGMGSYFPPRRGRFALERQSPSSTSPRPPLGAKLRFLAAYASRFDPLAIEAAFRGVFKNGRPVDPARVADVRKPVLVVAGTLDAFFEPAKALARQIPGARFVELPNEGHLSAVRNPRFRTEVAAFLNEYAQRPSQRSQ